MQSETHFSQLRDGEAFSCQKKAASRSVCVCEESTKEARGAFVSRLQKIAAHLHLELGARGEFKTDYM